MCQSDHALEDLGFEFRTVLALLTELVEEVLTTCSHLHHSLLPLWLYCYKSVRCCPVNLIACRICIRSIHLLFFFLFLFVCFERESYF